MKIVDLWIVDFYQTRLKCCLERLWHLGPKVLWRPAQIEFLASPLFPVIRIHWYERNPSGELCIWSLGYWTRESCSESDLECGLPLSDPTNTVADLWMERVQTDPQISNGCQDYYGGQIINTTQLNFNITGREIPRFSLVVRIMVVKISTQNLQV